MDVEDPKLTRALEDHRKFVALRQSPNTTALDININNAVPGGVADLARRLGPITENLHTRAARQADLLKRIMDLPTPPDTIFEGKPKDFDHYPGMQSLVGKYGGYDSERFETAFDLPAKLTMTEVDLDLKRGSLSEIRAKRSPVERVWGAARNTTRMVIERMGKSVKLRRVAKGLRRVFRPLGPRGK